MDFYACDDSDFILHFYMHQILSLQVRLNIFIYGHLFCGFDDFLIIILILTQQISFIVIVQHCFSFFIGDFSFHLHQVVFVFYIFVYAFHNQAPNFRIHLSSKYFQKFFEDTGYIMMIAMISMTAMISSPLIFTIDLLNYWSQNQSLNLNLNLSLILILKEISFFSIFYFFLILCPQILIQIDDDTFFFFLFIFFKISFSLIDFFILQVSDYALDILILLNE